MILGNILTKNIPKEIGTNNNGSKLLAIARYMNIKANNIIFLAPSSYEEYIAMLDWAIDWKENPVMIRVPWNGVHHTDREIPKTYCETRNNRVK